MEETGEETGLLAGEEGQAKLRVTHPVELFEGFVFLISEMKTVLSKLFGELNYANEIKYVTPGV
jgi:hypothetical protein